MSARPSEVTPDRALVFEVIGSVAKFIEAARKAGLEWLTEAQDDDNIEDYDSEEEKKDNSTDTTEVSLLYVTMPSIKGLQRVLSLWKSYAAGDSYSSEFKDWWAIFGYLSKIRTWAAQDRIDPFAQAHIARMLGKYPERAVRLELDLWFREEPKLRSSARSYVEALMASIGGRVLDFGTIQEIRYQAALVELPGGEAQRLSLLDGPLANADRVMRVRPQSLYTTEECAPFENEGDERAIPAAIDMREPVVALLDGYPLQNHALLANRVDIDEIDITGEMSPVGQRYHGTAMASLIIHGDLASHLKPVSRLLKVVPVLATPQTGGAECTPLDKLPIMMVYRAVQALVGAARGTKPRGEKVVVINHSICDQGAPFVRYASPWAKLLDHLAYSYDLLFVVSAGNCNAPFRLDTYSSCEEFAQADAIARQIVILRSIERSKGSRSLLSPAESINSLTIGATHDDGSGECEVDGADPFSRVGVTNIASGLGLGLNRAIKPDLIEAGGRQLVRAHFQDGSVTVWGYNHADIGQLAAALDPSGRTTTNQVRLTGTSNAAALLTRSAMQLVDVVEGIYAEEGENWNNLRSRAVILKALLTHSSRWGDTGKLLNEICPGNWRKKRESISRFLGYGRSDLERILSAGENRITLLADDIIISEQRHEYRIPIPRDMIGNRELRRIVLTLAWSTPIDPTSIRYRGVFCEMLDEDGRRDFWDGIKKDTLQPHSDDTRRGTLQHLIFEGKKLVKGVGSGEFVVNVQCRAQIDKFKNAEVPYALAVTLEVAQPVRSSLYEDILARVRTPRIETSVSTPVRMRQRAR